MSYPTLEILSEFSFDGMTLVYLKQGETIGFLPMPTSRKEEILRSKSCTVEPLVQVRLVGDDFHRGFRCGMTLRGSETTQRLTLLSQSRIGDTVRTVLSDGRGHTVEHIARMLRGFFCVECFSRIINESEVPATLELLSSFTVTNLSPVQEVEDTGTLWIHRLRSFWSAEGFLCTQTTEELGLEKSWSVHAVRSEVFGTIGSVPVREWFPFLAVEDRKNKLLWGVQLACPSSWQMEISRHETSINLMGGLADSDRGQWRKTLQPGESFTSPSAMLTCSEDGLDELCWRLTFAQRRTLSMVPESERDLPIMFNEWCTTWGHPSLENLTKIAEILEGKGITYMTIDAGWYADQVNGWGKTIGDWVVNPDMFPHGIREAANMIRAHGMIPGIWFELESVGRLSRAFQLTDHLLKRDGYPITVYDRRFWDMEDPWVADYLSEKVIGLLREGGFGYVKIDYNETVGMGCDGPESRGENLRRKLQATQRFFRAIREAVPNIVIENCSSGGHRLEPSMMALASQASFSDAHECLEIPVIAANLHRAILPAQSQIWAVIRHDADDTVIFYRMISTLLGRMCLSGDIYDLSEHQWSLVEEGMDFYRQAVPIIRDGMTRFLTPRVRSYYRLTGAQAIWRGCGDQALLVIHRFEMSEEESISLPSTVTVTRSYGSPITELTSGCLRIFPGSYAAQAYLLRVADAGTGSRDV